MVYLIPPEEEIDHSCKVFFNLFLHKVGYRLVTDWPFYEKYWKKREWLLKDIKDGENTNKSIAWNIWNRTQKIRKKRRS